MIVSSESKDTWLLVAPHSDDLVFGMGGLLARKYREGGMPGKLVWVVVTSPPVMGMESHGSTYQGLRLDEEVAAAKLVGVDTVYSLGFKEAHLDNAPRAALVSRFDTLLDEVGPTHVFMPLPSFHQDHVAVHEAMVTALRPTRNEVQHMSVWAYEYPGNSWGPLPPKHGWLYISMSEEDARVKKAMLECYGCQFEHRPTAHVSIGGGMALLSFRGSEAACGYAERFGLMRMVV